MTAITTTCCIAGGGPAGMMLGLLLARSGVPVTVLEKHKDFLRDFRGDTIHPSTLEIMHELGLLGDFLKIPHGIVRQLDVAIGHDRITIGHFEHLPVHCRFIALMPQWDFLDFLAGQARRYSGFTLRMRTEALGLLYEDGRVAGVRARTPEGELEIRAALTIGCDGRHSTLRACAGLEGQRLGAPMDVLWFRLSRKPDDPGEAVVHIESGRMLVMLNRSDYWQSAYVIPKGAADEVERAGLPAFRGAIATMAPFLNSRLEEIAAWEQVKLLTVEVDRLRCWYREALLCIGDAAHAMSPVGGVGINLAVQDAVATANILAGPLRSGGVTTATLAAVQRRREFPTRVTQRLQLLKQNRIIGPALANSATPRPPFFLRALQWPLLRRLPGRLLALGVRPEHVRTQPA
jgi:2-polyprenyl-6-methoxyphenol hydroxylase-like FAD-dependent oxidoreductase